MSMEKFFTRDVANEGIEIPLYLPGTDTKSGEWIRIRGVDSDEFRLADLQAKRNLRKFSESGVLSDSVHQDEMRRLIASLVISWSFEQECNPKAVEEFLKNAPQIQDAINQLASKRALFFKNGSTGSVNTPEPNSN